MAKAKRTGGELEASYGIGQWQYNLNYSRVWVTDSNNGSGLFSPPDKLSLQVRHQLPRQGITLSWTTTGVAAQDYDATVLRRRPGYATSDLFVSWTPSGQKFHFDVGVGNIFDHRYAAAVIGCLCLHLSGRAQSENLVQHGLLRGRDG